MARPQRNDLLAKLADISEDAIQRLSDAPGAERVTGVLNATRDRVDDLQRRVRGLEELEKRLAALERKVDKLSKNGPTESASRSHKTTTTKSSGGSRAKHA